MKDLLKCELFKLKKNMTFIVVSSVAVGYGILMVVVFAVLAKILGFSGLFNGMTFEQLSESGEAVSLMGILTVYLFVPGASLGIGAIFFESVIWFIMLAVVITSIVVGDYQRGIIRNLVMSGKSRTAVYFSKMIICLSYAIILPTIVMIFSVALNAIIFGWGVVPVGKFFLSYVLSVLIFAAFGSVVTLICFVTKNTGAAIGISIALSMVMYFFSVIAYVVNLMSMDNEALKQWGKVLEFLSECYVGNALAVALNPFMSTARIVKALIVGVVTLGGATTLGWYLFKTKDLK